MKQLLAGLLATVLALPLWGQTVTLQFEGTSKTRNYQVVIDETTYRSADAVVSGKKKMMTMNNLTPGSHTLAVYPADESVTSGNLLYSNTFQLREGYDLDIVVKADGVVSFTEKRNTHTAVSSGSYNAEAAMSSTDFNRLAQSVRNKLLQSARTNTVRTAFTTTSNRFTTDQIAKLLSYISSEPTRLDLAKTAYARVVDPANYKNLSDVFTSETLRSELDFFLRNTTINPAGGTPADSDTSSAQRTIPSNDTGTSERIKKEVIIQEADAEAEKEAETAKPNTSTSMTVTSGGADTKASSTIADEYSGRSPVSDRTFNQLMRRMRNQRAQQGKMAMLTNAFEDEDHYFTTSQLRQLITPITAEADRLRLAKLAYSRTADTANFKSLYDLFNDRYKQMELDHFVRAARAGNTASTAANSAYSQRVAIDETNYSRLDLKVHFHLYQPGTVAEIKKAFSGKNYFTAEQIHQWLSLVSAEEERLALAKLAYLRITDPTTFESLYDLFPSKESREELDQYIAENKY